MARRRDDRFLIDLTADGLDDGAPADLDAPATSEPATGLAARAVAAVGRRWRATSRRARVAIIGLTAVVIAAVGVGSAVADARHAAHMAAMPGGVADLSSPLQETWRVESDGGILAVLPGGMVVTRDGGEVLAVDVATGGVAWRHDLGEGHVDCGPQPLGSLDMLRTVDRVVCVSGARQRTVTVLTADGEILGQRDADVPAPDGDGFVVDTSQVVPAADGTVAVMDARELMLETADPREALAMLEELRRDGSWVDPVVRLEDALTGEVRVQTTLELRTPEDLARCGIMSTGDSEDSIWLYTQVLSRSTGTQASLCGKTYVLTSDDATGREVNGLLWPLVDGGYQVLDDDGVRLVDSSGNDNVLVEGYVLDPMAVDGIEGPRLTLTEDGSLAAVDDSGEVLWRSDLEQVSGVLARADGVVVVSAGGSDLVGIDVATGAVRWTQRDVLADSRAIGWLGSVASVVTDGRLVLVAGSAAGGVQDLQAIGLADGSTRWRTQLEQLTGNGAGIAVVDGHLVMTVQAGESATSALVGLDA